jgi:hypothetical protein
MPFWGPRAFAERVNVVEKTFNRHGEETSVELNGPAG